MKKVLFIIAAMLISFSALTAQSIWSFQYSFAAPTGETKEFTDDISGRGFIIEGKSFATNTITFGGLIAWNVFTDDIADGEMTIGDAAVFGHQYRYINTMPLMASVSYYPSNGKGKTINPFVSLGVGTIFQEKLMDIGTKSLYLDGWMFGLAPEIGVSIKLPGGFDLIANYKYMYGFETSNVSQLSYSNLNIGFGVTY